MILAAVLLVGGIVLLTFCADLAVTAAEKLSDHLGISPVIVGALVVGLGTSLPEMVVSGIAAAQRDTIDLAVGNVTGSNAANLSLVLGIGAIITSIGGNRKVMQREGIMMLVATAMFVGFTIDDELARWEGIVLLAGMVVAAVLIARTPGVADDPEAPGTDGGEFRSTIVRAVAGLVGVLVGAQLMVTGAVDIATELGASEAFIGLSIVAIGTSLPELATTVVSARRGSIELVVGNVLGSNLFNALAVAGIAGLVGNGVIEESNLATVLTMAGISVFVVLWGIVYGRFDRLVGIALVLAYAALLVVGA